jgi:hypothetical protein
VCHGKCGLPGHQYGDIPSRRLWDWLYRRQIHHLHHNLRPGTSLYADDLVKRRYQWVRCYWLPGHQRDNIDGGVRYGVYG